MSARWIAGTRKATAFSELPLKDNRTSVTRRQGPTSRVSTTLPPWHVPLVRFGCRSVAASSKPSHADRSPRLQYPVGCSAGLLTALSMLNPGACLANHLGPGLGSRASATRIVDAFAILTGIDHLISVLRTQPSAPSHRSLEQPHQHTELVRPWCHSRYSHQRRHTRRRHRPQPPYRWCPGRSRRRCLLLGLERHHLDTLGRSVFSPLIQCNHRHSHRHRTRLERTPYWLYCVRSRRLRGLISLGGSSK